MAEPRSHSVTPLQALAESSATPKAVRATLTRIAQRVLKHCNNHRVTLTQAKALMRWVLDAYLDLHYFANFGRKKAVDKVISKATRNYKSRLVSELRGDLVRAKKTGRVTRESWLESQLTSSNPGRTSALLRYVQRDHSPYTGVVSVATRLARALEDIDY